MQAIILAAGMGKRLKQLTDNNTKCMVKVNGVTMIERMLRQLDELNLNRIILVIGYEGEKLVNYISTLDVETPIVYETNEVYYKTNNIYSLYLAKEYLLEDDTLLLESDLIFEDTILKKIMDDPYPSLALVAKYESWMDGTVVTLDDDHNIRRFLDKKRFRFEDIQSYYKTVNIYKFSKRFSNTHYVPFLEAYSKALGDNEYYEQVLKVITLLEKPEIKASVLDNESWYEIDDLQDLDIAESMFTKSPLDKLKKFQNRYGGYWRYPKLADYNLLVNPFYPPQKLLDEIKANFDRIISDYPSGMNVNALLAGKYFGIDERRIVVGNGAAELIKSLMEKLEGTIGIPIPTFDEYPNRKKENEIVYFKSEGPDYHYTADELISFFDDKNISTLLLVNPENPSGNFIPKKELLRIADWAEKKNNKFILDESFVDFAQTDDDIPASLLNEEILAKYPSLTVIKSISKSHGVPGLRLGILASYDQEVINFIKKDVAIWNINSFAEFYLQIFEKYITEYEEGLKSFKEERETLRNELSIINNLRIIPSQANYFLCELLNGFQASEIAADLLDQYHLFVKDLTNKKGFDGNYLRVAVKSPEENKRLVDAFKNVLT